MSDPIPLFASGFSYCYVRFKGGYHRTRSLKLFYTDQLLLSDFISHCRQRGEIARVDFPPQLPIPMSELESARSDGRVL